MFCWLCPCTVLMWNLCFLMEQKNTFLNKLTRNMAVTGTMKVYWYNSSAIHFTFVPIKKRRENSWHNVLVQEACKLNTFMNIANISVNHHKKLPITYQMRSTNNWSTKYMQHNDTDGKYLPFTNLFALFRPILVHCF